ncbi:hypothetical protein BD779DRAFT_1011095 [Infundibulicybe gibba]|nr:hypothetical protein BD779DRAFT_1011095 [Infundibulicybe gibba]
MGGCCHSRIPRTCNTWRGIRAAGLFNSSLWKTDEDRVIRLFQLTGIATNSISLSVNALTTIVTKILLTAREVRVSWAPTRIDLSDRHSMLIESGLLMFAFQLSSSFYTTEWNLTSFLAQSPKYGITPTLLNIRVAMGTAYDKTTEKTRTLRLPNWKEPPPAQA